MPRRIVPPPPIKILFIGGTGRCGTTWTRRVIAAHRDVFDVPVECNMRDHLISGYIERAKADGYRWMAEKSPSNALCAREILRRYKDSRYLHVSRERSAVIASTMRAGRYHVRCSASTVTTAASSRSMASSFRRISPRAMPSRAVWHMRPSRDARVCFWTLRTTAT